MLQRRRPLKRMSFFLVVILERKRELTIKMSVLVFLVDIINALKEKRKGPNA